MDVTSEEQVERGVADAARSLGRLDVAVDQRRRRRRAHHRVRALRLAPVLSSTSTEASSSPAAMRHWQAAGKGGLLLYMGSVHSVEASPLKSAYVAPKHGLWVWPGRRRRKGEDRRAHQRHLPGFRPHPAGGEADPRAGEDARHQRGGGGEEGDAGGTVDGEFTTLEDIAQLAIDLAAFPARH